MDYGLIMDYGLNMDYGLWIEYGLNMDYGLWIEYGLRDYGLDMDWIWIGFGFNISELNGYGLNLELELSPSGTSVHISTLNDELFLITQLNWLFLWQKFLLFGAIFCTVPSYENLWILVEELLECVHTFVLLWYSRHSIIGALPFRARTATI